MGKSPALILLSLSVLVPALMALVISFTQTGLDVTEPLKFIGLTNFQRLLGDPMFYQVLGTTLIYLFGVVPPRFAEGTWKNGLDIGYRVMFGGGLMGSMDRHPDRVIYSSRYASAAAGAYQFMPFTWDLVKRSLGVRGFGPEVQDQGALFLVQRRKALRLTDVGVMTPQLAAKLAPEWASFPTLRGRSYYGQPVKRFANLQSFYQVNLSQLRQISDAIYRAQ